MQQRAEVTPKPDRIKTAAEYIQSGMTMAAWSKERQINRYTLHNWVEEFRRETKQPAHSCEWMEIKVDTGVLEDAEKKETAVKTTTATYMPIRISIGNTQIEVTSGFDESALAAVIRTVRYQC